MKYNTAIYIYIYIYIYLKNTVSSLLLATSICFLHRTYRKRKACCSTCVEIRVGITPSQVSDARRYTISSRNPVESHASVPGDVWLSTRVSCATPRALTRQTTSAFPPSLFRLDLRHVSPGHKSDPRCTGISIRGWNYGLLAYKYFILVLSFFLVWHTAVLSPGVNDTILTRVFRTHKLFLMRGRNGGGKYYFFGKGGSIGFIVHRLGSVFNIFLFISYSVPLYFYQTFLVNK